MTRGFPPLDARQLEHEIRIAHQERLARLPKDGDLGWRLLYSPERVLTGARVAFIGLNPGGSIVNPAHGEFSSEKGSAYRKDIEDWGVNSGLQDQVIELFRRLGVEPEEVLAGNLVPFRSCGRKSLRRPSEAIQFGVGIWRRILDVAKPTTVVAMGNDARKETQKLLNVREVRDYSVNWQHNTASWGKFDGGIWIGLPHLSQFPIMKRKDSAYALEMVFKGLNGR